MPDKHPIIMGQYNTYNKLTLATMREAIRSKYKIENGETDKRHRFKK